MQQQRCLDCLHKVACSCGLLESCYTPQWVHGVYRVQHGSLVMEGSKIKHGISWEVG